MQEDDRLTGAILEIGHFSSEYGRVFFREWLFAHKTPGFYRPAGSLTLGRRVKDRVTKGEEFSGLESRGLRVIHAQVRQIETNH